MLPKSRKNNGSIFKVNSPRGVIGKKIKVASGFFSRFKGLMGVKQLDDEQGLLIVPCTSIHMFFMKIPLDVVFVDKKGVVRALYEDFKPWGLSRYHPEAYGVLELPVGKIAEHQLQEGNQLEFIKIS